MGPKGPELNMREKIREKLIKELLEREAKVDFDEHRFLTERIVDFLLDNYKIKERS